jgi:hypothetical protein
MNQSIFRWAVGLRHRLDHALVIAHSIAKEEMKGKLTSIRP